jgi:hypothetical protein
MSDRRTVSDKVEALREAIERAIPGLDEEGMTQPHWPSLEVVFAAARLLADNPALYEMLEAGAVVERHDLRYDTTILIVKEQPR